MVLSESGAQDLPRNLELYSLCCFLQTRVLPQQPKRGKEREGKGKPERKGKEKGNN